MPVDLAAVERAQNVTIKPMIDTRTIEPPKAALDIKFDSSNLDALMNGDAGSPIIKIGGEVVKEEKTNVNGTQDVKTDAPVITPSPVPKKKTEIPAVDKSKEEISEPILKPPVEEKKEVVQDKKAEEAVSKTDETSKPTDLSKLIKPPGSDEDKFDYTAYDAATQVNLRNMSRQSREWVAGVIKKNQELESNKTGQFYNHEEGYVLSPEFKQLQQKDSFNRAEGQAWQEALMNIRQGKPYKNIIGFDPQTGKPLYSAELQPTDADQIRVEQNLSKCMSAIESNKSAAINIAGSHSNRVKADLATIDAVRKERFSWAQDPKVLEYSIKTSSGVEKKLKDIISDFKSVWPSYAQNHPAVQVASDLMVALEIRTAELRDALAKAAVAKIKVGEAARGEPKSDHQPTSDGKDTYKIGNQEVPKTFSLDMMPT